jgi:lactate dehydrogenase-like 2-hydroxyacid dehydrogenase
VTIKPDSALKPEIVIVGPMYPPTQQRLEALFTAHRLWEAADRNAFLGALRERVRGIAVYALHGCPTALIQALPRLEIIACFGIGVDLIDIAAARARGIPVTNTPDVVTDDTADIALALILAVERRIAEGDRFVRRGDWAKGELCFGRRLGGRKLGIVGLGRIGRAIARRAEAVGVALG